MKSLTLRTKLWGAFSLLILATVVGVVLALWLGERRRAAGGAR